MTFLQHLGSIFKKILHIGVTVAGDLEPVVDLALPGIGDLYNSAVGLAIAAEGTAAAATGTGTQKLAQVVSGLTPLFEQWAAQNNYKVDNTKISAWASAIADTLNNLPIIPPATTTGVTALPVVIPGTEASVAAAAHN